MVTLLYSSALAPGGGVLYPLSPKLKVLVQIDFPQFIQGGGTEHAFRLVGGVVLPIGGH